MIPKFRAWSSKTAVLAEVINIDLRERKLKVSHWEYGDSIYLPLGEVELMQSTGLKDKNGVEIFEGDILTGQQHLTTDITISTEVKGIVKYSSENTMFYLEEKNSGHDKFMHSLGSSIYEYEIMGNVWENDDLLEVAE